MYTLFIYY